MATLSASKWIEAERQIQELASSFNEISILCNHIRKSIEASEAYSYQFNIKIVVSGDKDVYIMGDFNIDLLKCESSQISQDFLLSLRSCYLIPTVDKATSVHRTSATLIDDTLTILTHSSQAETLFLILVIIFRSSVSQRQRKINFNKA